MTTKIRIDSFRHSRQLLKLGWPVLCGLAAAGAAAQSGDGSFAIRGIRIDGLEATPAASVLAVLPVQVGDLYSDAVASAIVNALHRTGKYSQVKLEVGPDDVLAIEVQERGASVSSPAGSAARPTVFAQAPAVGGKQPDASSAPATSVTPSSESPSPSLPRLRTLEFSGVASLSESSLRKQMGFDAPWPWSSGGFGPFSREKFPAALTELRNHYRANGFLDAEIRDVREVWSDDRREVSITVVVHEGRRYKFSSFEFDQSLRGHEDAYRQLLTVKPGEPYDGTALGQSVRNLGDRLADDGFALARVDALMTPDEATGQVAITFQADTGLRMRVRGVRVAGEDGKRDEVVLREFRPYEGAAYSGNQLRMSQARLMRLGYFKDVRIDVAAVEGQPGQVDLLVRVAEKPQGGFSVTVSATSAEKVGVAVAVKQDNALGADNNLTADVSHSRYNTRVGLGLTNPYVTPGGVSRTLELFYRSSRPYDDQGGDYHIATQGATLRYAIPLGLSSAVLVGAGLESTRVNAGSVELPPSYANYLAHFGNPSHAVPLTLAFAHDTRNDSFAPTAGRLLRVATEWSPWQDARYVRTDYQAQQYLPLGKRVTLAFNAELGVGRGTAGRIYPVFKNYVGGGLGSVRGFEQGTLGPREGNSVVGGPKRAVFNFELLTPMPGVSDEPTLRLFTFFDIGGVFAENEKMAGDQMRRSAGLGLSWNSPIGPLRIAFAHAVRKFPGDKTQKLQFQTGATF